MRKLAAYIRNIKRESKRIKSILNSVRVKINGPYDLNICKDELKKILETL